LRKFFNNKNSNFFSFSFKFQKSIFVKTGKTQFFLYFVKTRNTQKSRNETVLHCLTKEWKLLKNHNICQKWPILIIFLFQVAKILKNCLKKEKRILKSCVRKFSHPFSTKQRQNLEHFNISVFFYIFVMLPAPLSSCFRIRYHNT